MTAFGKKFLKMKMNLMRKMTMKMFKTFVLTWKKLKFAKLDFFVKWFTVRNIFSQIAF